MTRAQKQMQPPFHLGTADAELDPILPPRRFFGRPAEVIDDPSLDTDEKRAILSSWASDASTVESSPALRRPPFARRPVTVDEVLEALLALDRSAENPAASSRAVKVSSAAPSIGN